MSLKKSVKRLCIDHNLTFEEIASALGMSTGGFRKSVNDEKLSFDKIKHIASLMNKEPSYFISLGESNEQSNKQQ